MQRILNKFNLLFNKFTPNSKKSWFVFVTLFLMAGIFTVQPAFATDYGQAMFDGVMRALTWIVLGLSTWCIQMTIFLLEFVIEIAGYNGYLNTPAVTVGWVMVRDVTNMFFVIILLIIAFGTILGLEQYEWKKMMLKFVLAAVLVNFSRTICGLFIDVAQVFMITFVNAVAATAGGNIIRMFAMEEIVSFNEGSRPEKFTDANMFIAGAAGLFFAAIMLCVMFAYMIILLFRMLVLWVLIILSPLAFVLNVIPQTQSYSARWWKEFGNHVMVGPVLIFFLWLSFVTAGAGNIHDHVRSESAPNAQMDLTTKDPETGQDSEANAGLTAVLEWSTMANFFIAIGMLLVGVRVTNELGVEGGGALNKAVDFGKKAAMMGTGVAAGMWGAKKAVEGGKKAGKFVAAPFTDRAKMVGKRIQSKYLETGFGQRGLKREAQLSQLDKGIEAQKAEIKAKGKMEKDMFTGDTDAFVGDKIIDQEIAEREQKGIEDKYVGEKKIKLNKDETNAVEAEVKKLEIKLIEEKFDELEDVNLEVEETHPELAENFEKKVKEAFELKGEVLEQSEVDNLLEQAKVEIAQKDYEDKKVEEAKQVAVNNGKEFSGSDEASVRAKALATAKAKEEYEKLKVSSPDMSEKEMKQRAIAEAGGLTRQEKGFLYQQAAENTGSKIMQSYLKEGKAGQKMGKAESLYKQGSARVQDELRAQEGKLGDKTIEFEDAENQDDMSKLDRMNYTEKDTIIKSEYAKIRDFRSKEKKEGLNFEEKTLLKNSVQNMGRTLTSMYKDGDSEWLLGTLQQLDSSFEGINFNDPKNNHILDMALMTGGSKDEFIDKNGNQKVENQQKLQEEFIRKNLREKEGAIMRGLMRSKNNDASQNGAIENNHQLLVGKDEFGNNKVGFSNIASGGSTGRGNVLSTGSDMSGSAIRKGKTDVVLAGKKAGDIGGASMVSTKTEKIEINGNDVEVASDYSNQEIADKIFTTIIDNSGSLSLPQINASLGGQYDKSTWDENFKKFHFKGGVKDNWVKIFDEWKKGFNSENAQVKDRLIKDAKTFLSKAGVKDAQNVVDLIKDAKKGNYDSIIK